MSSEVDRLREILKEIATQVQTLPRSVTAEHIYTLTQVGLGNSM